MEQFTREEIDELYHHGILGMKWGIRRYQNKDGSLTAAGKKRRQTDETKARIRNINEAADAKVKRLKSQGKLDAKVAKAQAKADARVARAESRLKGKSKTSTESDAESESKPKKKSISEMSDEELQQRINRIRLEQQYKALTPQKVSKGKELATKFFDQAVMPAMQTAGKKAIEKAMDQLMEKAGLTKKEKKSLKEQAEEATNKASIVRGAYQQELYKQQLSNLKKPADTGNKETATSKSANTATTTATDKKSDAGSKTASNSNSGGSSKIDLNINISQQATEKAKTATQEASKHTVTFYDSNTKQRGKFEVDSILKDWEDDE